MKNTSEENPKQEFYTIKDLLLLSGDMKESYQLDSFRKNHYAMNTIAVLIFVFELFNIARVLFFSRSGLSTLNNRIYFSMYCVLIGIAAAELVLERRMMKGRREWLLHLYDLSALAWMMWHAVMNAYDLIGDKNSGTVIFLTGLFGISIFIQMKPVHAVVIFLTSYITFLSLSAPVLDFGAAVNLTFFVIVSIIISVTRYIHTVTELYQKMEIHNMNETLKREQEALRLSLEKHEIIMEQAREIIFEWDIEEDRLIFSQNCRDRFPLADTVFGVRRWILEKSAIYEQDRQAFADMLQRCVEDRAAGRMELRIVDRVGKAVWYEARIILQYNDSGAPVYGIGVFSDINERKVQIEQLATQVQIDPLTGILNRLAFQQNTQKCLSELAEGGSLAMIMLDLDDFKQINDEYGHPKGDYVLKEIAGILQRTFRADDLLGRLGGDEFGIVLLNVENGDFLAARAQNLLAEVAKIELVDGVTGISCSLGFAVARSSSMTYEQLYENADAALYTAKRRNKGSYCIPMSSVIQSNRYLI